MKYTISIFCIILLVAVIALIKIIGKYNSITNSEQYHRYTSRIKQQQIVVDAYIDSLNTCSESKLKYYGDLYEIESMKLKELKEE